LIADLDRDAPAGSRSAIIGVGRRRAVVDGRLVPGQGGIVLRGFIAGTIVTAIAFFVLTQVLPTYTSFDMVSYDGDLIGIVVLALIFGVVNGLIGPIVRALALPISFATLGLVGFLINAGLLLLTAAIAQALKFDLKVGDFPPDLLTADTLVAAVVGALVLSAVSTIVRMVTPA
jgi:putative membrane protein